MWKKRFLFCVKVLFLFGLFYVFSKVNIGVKVSPFSISLLLSLLYHKKGALVSAVCFLISYILAGWSLHAIYIGLNVFAVVVVTSIILNKSHLKLNKYSTLVPTALSLVGYSYFCISATQQSLQVIFAIVLAVVLEYCGIVFLGAFFRENSFNLNADEIICGSVFVIVFAMGLSVCDLFYFQFSKLIGVLLILILVSSAPEKTFLLATLFGLGVAVSSLELSAVVIYVFFSLTALAFKSNLRLLSVIAVILTEIILGLFFKVYTYFNWFNLLSIGVAGALYLVLPKKVFEKFKLILCAKRDNLAIRSVVNRTKIGLTKRINELSHVFDEMNVVYRGMIKGELPERESRELVLKEVCSKVCDNCPDRMNCNRNNNVNDALDMVIESGFNKGKITLLDIPQCVADKCGRINIVVNTINNNIKSIKNYTHLVNNMDASRVLIADQLVGVKEMLTNLADEVRQNITFDLDKENRLVEELGYSGVVCYEAIAYESGGLSQNVTLVIRTGEIRKETIEKVVTKICGVNMGIVSSDINQIPNSTVVNLRNKGNFDLVFGCSSVSKKGDMKCGDAHSVVKLGGGKYMVALCDGIGSGEKAHKISNLSITLIENFYKAGFENDTILSSINKLLSLNNEENFSSVDLCVLDFNKNIADFIKLGATYGFIKNSKRVDVIESSGLPIGVLEEMRPHITKRIISPFDNIILLSDGITDAFDTKEDLVDFIENIRSINPQTISEEILDRAIDLNDGKIKDDMTVLVARVFPI